MRNQYFKQWDHTFLFPPISVSQHEVLALSPVSFLAIRKPDDSLLRGEPSMLYFMAVLCLAEIHYGDARQCVM